ncbi:MAG: MFS transporter [Acidobacteria bacterium]|nr:MFS transporter [Acidobacteriota bacterium]
MHGPGPAYSHREQAGWYFYDWANSAFSTTVVTLLLGPWLTELAQAAANGRRYIFPLGVPVDPLSYWAYLLSLSVMTQMVFLPLLGAIADYSPRKRTLLAVFAYAGAAATMCMFFLEKQRYLLGGALFLIANLSYGASAVIYNSYLPEIAPPEERDAVSSKGWGIGYLGGGLLLAGNLLITAKAGAFGLTQTQAVRISFFSAGAWWALFTIIPLLALRKREPVRVLAPGEGYFSAGFRHIARTLANMRQYPQSLKFLLAYLLYSDAIQAVITLSGQFGSTQLKIPIPTIALAILMVQFVAFFGAMLFNWIAARIGAKRAVMLSLVIWTAVLVYIYLSVRTTAQFFMMAAAVAIVLGGSQALSRSLYSQMIPKGKEAEYFSIYEISDKGTSWLAPLLFALALQFTGSYRVAILSLIVFFVLGLGILSRVDVRRGAADAGAAL